MDEDGLTPGELNPAGGGWAAALDDLYRPGPTFSWSFGFEFAEVSREYGDTTPHVSIDRVHLPTSSWTRMAGLRAIGTKFGEPIEASVYFFEHFRYDEVDLQIVDQRGPQVHVLARVEGDVDQLGIERFDLDAWLSFRGVDVTLSDRPPDIETARERLAAVSDVTGFAGTSSSYGYSFRPAEPPDA